MKRNQNFLMRTVAGKQVIVPVGKAAIDFVGMVTVNETGAFLWEQLAQEQTLETLVKALTDTYDVEQEMAQRDVQVFLEKLRSVNALED